ncbi:MAG: phosphatase PAP2 family protein [Kineosporiaceae bacterium]
MGEGTDRTDGDSGTGPDSGSDPGSSAGGTRAGLVAAGSTVSFAVLAVTVRIDPGPLHRLDHGAVTIGQTLVRPRPWLRDLLDTLALLTGPGTWRLLAVALAGLLWWRGRRSAALRLLAAMAVGGVLGMALKVLFARDRPALPDPVASVEGYSFPSGHAVNSLLFAAAVLTFLPPALARVPRGPAPARVAAGAAAAVAVLVTGLDRVGLGVHYPSDVLGGWLVALAVVAGVAAVPRRRSGYGSGVRIGATAGPRTSTQPGRRGDCARPGAPRIRR